MKAVFDVILMKFAPLFIILKTWVAIFIVVIGALKVLTDPEDYKICHIEKLHKSIKNKRLLKGTVVVKITDRIATATHNLSL